MGADEGIAEARERLKALIDPIDGGVGRDVSYEPSFEAVKNEVDKMQSLEGGRIDWSAVVSGSETILSEESKDFRVVLYYGVGRAQLHGAAGVFDALVLLDALIEAYWEPMYPALKRPRARGNLCSWFNDLTAPVVDAWNPTKIAERDVAIGMEVILRRVDGELADKLGDAYPGMIALREAARRLGMRAPAEAPPPPPPAPPPPPPSAASPASEAAPVSEAAPSEQSESAPASTSSGGAGAGWSPDDIEDRSTAYRAISEVLPLYRKAGAVLLAEDTSSAEGYRFSLVGALLFLNAELAASDGETEVEPPDEGAVAAVVESFQGSDWESAARGAVGLCADNPLWLDGYYYAASALEKLGDSHVAARRTVEGEIAALAKRIPQLGELKFSGGTPFAGGDAKEWLAGLASAEGGGGGGGKDPLAKPLKQAREQLAAEQGPQAMATMQRVAVATTSPVVRFRAKLEGAKLALLLGQLDIARAQLEGLDRVAEKHRLSEWDPDLAVQLHTALYQAYLGLGYAQSELPEQRSRAATTWERLCELDPTAALRLVTEAT